MPAISCLDPTCPLDAAPLTIPEDQGPVLARLVLVLLGVCVLGFLAGLLFSAGTRAAAPPALGEIARGVLTWTYGVSGVIAGALCLPQIVRLVQVPETAAGFSLVTWGGWALLGLVAFGYALLVNQTVEMVLVTSLNALFQVVILTLTVRGRFLVSGAPARHR